MPDDPRDDSPGPDRTRRHRAFLVALGVCAGASVLGAVLALLDDSPEFGALRYLFAVPWVWIGTLLVGAFWWGVDEEVGPGILLGALAGAVVGFTLCSGVLIVPSLP